MRKIAQLALACLLLLPVQLTFLPLPAKVSRQEARCLASAIHYEARGEPLEGRRAVLDTIHHRMLEKGRSACSVVLQRRQFSWSSSKPLVRLSDEHLYRLEEVVQHPVVLKNNDYKYFYSGRAPAWASGMICKSIRNLNFCKYKESTTHG